MEERTAKRIIIEYEDGTIEEIEKGFVARLSENDETITANFSLAGVAGKDLKLLVLSVLELAQKLGLFKEEGRCTWPYTDPCPKDLGKQDSCPGCRWWRETEVQ